MEVTDASGRRVWTEQINQLSSGAQSMQIHTADWKPGIYFLVVYDDMGGRLINRVVKI
jgi:hypothetical protein